MRLKAIIAMAVFLTAIAAITTAQNYTTAEGGNVTRMDIIRAANRTTNWQGFAGRIFFGTNLSLLNLLNATGGLVNESDLFFLIDCDNPLTATGFVFLSNSTATPANLTPGNLTLLDTLLGNGHDDASATFSSTSSFALSTGTVSSVPTVFTFVNQTPQPSSFREGYFSQGNDIVFTTVIEEDLHGYNTSFFDYQALVPAANQSSVQYSVFGDITFTCPGAGVAVGGGGAKRLYIPIKIIRPKAEEPPRLEQADQLQEPELREFLRRLELKLPDETTRVLEGIKANGLLINRNDLYIPDVTFSINAPEMLLMPADFHPYRMLLWDSLLFGLKDHGATGPKTFTTQISGLPEPMLIAPNSETQFSFIATPPIMQPRMLELWVHAFAGQIRLAAGQMKLEVTVPEFAAFVLPVREDVKAVYFLVDNRAGNKKNINIEFALNRGRSTLAAEMLGPLEVPAGSVTVFSHEYKMSPAALTADRLAARTSDGQAAETILR